MVEIHCVRDERECPYVGWIIIRIGLGLGLGVDIGKSLRHPFSRVGGKVRSLALPQARNDKRARRERLTRERGSSDSSTTVLSPTRYS